MLEVGSVIKRIGYYFLVLKKLHRWSSSIQGRVYESQSGSFWQQYLVKDIKTNNLYHYLLVDDNEDMGTYCRIFREDEKELENEFILAEPEIQS